MSTPLRKKLARQQQQKEAAAKQRRQKELSSIKVNKEFIPYVPKQVYRPSTKEYRSFTSSPPSKSEAELFKHGTAKREVIQYSGDYVTGIATMHKSNLVPVGRGDNPEDYSTMRRN